MSSIAERIGRSRLLPRLVVLIFVGCGRGGDPPAAPPAAEGNAAVEQSAAGFVNRQDRQGGNEPERDVPAEPPPELRFAADGARFETLKPLGFDVRAISGDGSTVVGSDRGRPAVWTEAKGTLTLPVGAKDAEGAALCVSRDGRVVVGAHAGRAAVWTDAKRPFDLHRTLEAALPFGTLASSRATHVSDDGRIVAGECTGTGGRRVFAWTRAGGVEWLHRVSPCRRGLPWSCSFTMTPDGRVLVGVLDGNDLAYEAWLWSFDDEWSRIGLFRRPDTSGVRLPVLRAASDFGRFVVGDWIRRHRNGDLTTSAYLWASERQFRELEDLAGGGVQGRANAVSAAGEVVVGSGTRREKDRSVARAVAWTGDGEPIVLDSWLRQEFAWDFGPWRLADSVGVSDDGRVLVGRAVGPGESGFSWRLSLPERWWESLGTQPRPEARMAMEAELERLRALAAGGTLEAGETIRNSFGMRLAYAPPGVFRMGSPDDEPGHVPDERAVDVRLTRGFAIGVTEVTEDQWEAVMGTPREPQRVRAAAGQRSFGRRRGTPAPQPEPEPSGDRPVTTPHHSDAVAFCRRLSAIEGATYRLPSEAEWEYVCRAGTETAWSTGDDPATVATAAWCRTADSESGGLHPVAQKAPNAWGLYDMHGNAAERTGDWYGDYPYGPLIDWRGPLTGNRPVVRGGDWRSTPRNCRSAGRYALTTGSPGFRVVLELEGDEFTEPFEAGIAAERSQDDLTRAYRQLGYDVAAALEAVGARVGRWPDPPFAVRSVHLKRAEKHRRPDVPAEFRPRLDGDSLRLVSQCTQLSMLHLDDTEIGDDALDSLVRVQSLEMLRLAGSRIEGPGLAHLGELPKLIRLELPDSPLTDEGLRQVARMDSLLMLDVSGSRITDAGVAHLAELPALNGLDVSRTEVTDAGFAKLDVGRLSTLRAADTRIGLPTFRRLRNSSSLSFFELGGTGTDDAGLEALGSLARVRRLSLARTSVTDEGLKHLAGWVRLGDLDLSGTAVTGAALTILADGPPLRDLDLTGTAVVDLPVGEAQWPRFLQRLSLAGTGVTDEVLAGLPTLSRIVTLDLDRTAMTDAGLAALPDKFPSLGSLSLVGTPVTADGVAEAARFPKLRQLELDGERFSKADVEALRRQLPDCMIRCR